MQKRFYGSINKAEEQPDGTIRVYGIASTGSLDSQGEVVTPAAMKAAIPGYMRFGAVREMHGSTAAGTAISIDVDEDGVTQFAAHVVDPVSVLKVKTGVLKGFSIGGRATQFAPNNRSIITGLELSEVSLVDRPANPDAVITMYKADTPQDIAKAEQDQVSALTSVISALSALIPKLQAILATEAQEPPEVPAAPEAAAPVEAADAPPPAAATQEAAPEDQKKPAEAAPEGVAKAGARFSATTKAQLSELHDTVKACDKHLNGLGYKDTAKADEVELLKGEIASLKAQIAKPAPVPHAGVAIDKAADVAGGKFSPDVVATPEAIAQARAAAEANGAILRY